MRIDGAGTGPDAATQPINPFPVQTREAAQPVNPVESIYGGATPAERAQEAKAAMAHIVDRYDPAVDAKPSLETRISVDQGTHETFVQVVDTKRQTVLIELPPEKIRELSKSLAEAATRKLDVKA